MLIELFIAASVYVSPVEAYEMINLDSHERIEICTESEGFDRDCEVFEAIELRYVPNEAELKKTEASDHAGSMIHDIISGVGSKVGIGATIIVKVETKSKSTSADGAVHETETKVEVEVVAGAGSAAAPAAGGGSDNP